MIEDSYKKIKTNLFLVEVPVIATYTDEELDIYGLPQNVDVKNGFKRIDATEDKVRVMITIDNMIDMYGNGYPIKVINADDVTKIYKILEEYLNNLVYKTYRSLNRMVPQDPRIEEIDKFATEIFGYNKPTIVKDTVNAKNGFDLGMQQMSVANAQERHAEPRVLFSNDLNNQPVLDMDKFKRKSPIRTRWGVKGE